MRKPIGRIHTAAELAKDTYFTHFAAFDNQDQVYATVMLDFQPDYVRFRQVAVHPDRHGQGIGRNLMTLAEQIAKNRGAHQAILYARDIAVNFYTRLGYITEGDFFEEIGMPHIRMIKKL